MIGLSDTSLKKVADAAAKNRAAGGWVTSPDVPDVLVIKTDPEAPAPEPSEGTTS